MKLRNEVKYSYHEERAKWSKYDDMFPSEIERISSEVLLHPTDDISEYVNGFYKFLIKVGFEKSEIELELTKFLSP